MKATEKIRELRSQIQLHEEQISALKKELLKVYPLCEHTELVGQFCETFAYDMTPRVRCVDCSSFSRIPTKEETKEMYKEELRYTRDDDITEDELEEFYNKNPNGFNY